MTVVASVSSFPSCTWERILFPAKFHFAPINFKNYSGSVKMILLILGWHLIAVGIFTILIGWMAPAPFFSMFGFSILAMGCVLSFFLRKTCRAIGAILQVNPGRCRLISSSRSSRRCAKQTRALPLRALRVLRAKLQSTPHPNPTPETDRETSSTPSPDAHTPPH